MRKVLFWASAGLVTYTYAIFPLLVALRGALARRPYRSEPITPRVSLIIAARNEEAAIGSRLRNIDQLDYPAEGLELVLASDGSDDRTEEIVEAHAGRPVKLLRQPREGKAAALNAAVSAASGDILVFTDSNSRFAPDAVRELVKPFADPEVGGVAGNQVYERGGDAGAHGERAYWGADRLLKRAESAAGNAISATGAIYAIRRELFDPIPAGVTDDFYTSVGVIARGKRLVFAPAAIAYEPPAGSGRLEFRRKVRIMTRGLHAVLSRRELLDPRRHGFYAIQLASHKLLRRLMAGPILACSVLAASLWRHGPIYRLVTAAAGAFYALAAVGLASPRAARMRIFSLPAFIFSALAASGLATWNLLTGRRIDRWEPIHAEERPESRSS